jgi:hypothetical protein
MEFILQSLLLPRVADLVRPVVEQSDFLGLSFYPYGSGLGVLYGAPPLPEGPEQWRRPLEWVRQYTTKPIAVAETGYLSSDLSLDSSGVRFTGDPERQATFLRDLIAIAHRDRYLFVVWFVPIDYDRLYAKLPKGSEWKKMWLHAGLLDKDLRAKPAWAVWQAWNRGVIPELSQAVPVEPRRPPAGKARRPIRLGFTSSGDLFTCGPHQATLESTGRPGSSGPVMRWRFEYKKDWMWCTRDVPRGQLAGMTMTRLWIRSDREAMISLRLDEEGGESFFTLLPVGREWREHAVPLQSFGRDATTRGNQRLDPDQVVRVVLADGAGLDGAHGPRTIWIADLTLE